MFNRIKKMIAVNAAAIFFISLDRFLKVFAFNNQGRQFNILGEILNFSYHDNYYIAFSLPLHGRWLNIIIFLIILLLIFYWLKALLSGRRLTAVCLLAVVMGAASNLFDRLKYGYVIDYLDLKYFTVFNLADLMITAGIICLLFIKGSKSENN
ncbi:MAG: signal peptidase II [Parcubacteria group bacterium]|nr:signal peptidase II [Parcubacteria group bacterium]